MSRAGSVITQNKANVMACPAAAPGAGQPPARAARAILRASVRQADAGHGVCLTAPQACAPALLNACWSGTALQAMRKPHDAVAAADERASWKATIRTTSPGSS